VLVGPPTTGADWMSSARSPSVATRVLDAFDRFLHVEAVSGIVLLITAAAALLWANSPLGVSYQHLWHTPLTFAVGGWTISQPLHFWINDGLMTIFFLVVGLEIRREMHVGTLANLQVASLPLAAALGGVAVPALMYLALSADSTVRQGWAVPTATDIAFAVGILALLGKAVPAALRVLLLSLAVIDDLAAIIVIAVFYSGELAPSGLLIAVAGVLLVIVLQRLGVRSAFAYIAPGALLWFGLLRFGVHPTLAGVVLGLLTPIASEERGESPARTAARALRDVRRRSRAAHVDMEHLAPALRQLKHAERELLPPTVRVQMALHPWVAYGVMPLFALANAGIALDGLNLDAPESRSVALGVFLALVAGKPVGIVIASWLAVRAGWCRLPQEINWKLMTLLGCLGGIGFTMSIFIATLAFPDDALLNAAKFGVVTASAIAAVLGLALGFMLLKSPAARRAAATRESAIDPALYRK
jgi:Na+:H+ antiporter, NhaA family